MILFSPDNLCHGTKFLLPCTYPRHSGSSRRPVPGPSLSRKVRKGEKGPCSWGRHSPHRLLNTSGSPSRQTLLLGSSGQKGPGRTPLSDPPSSGRPRLDTNGVWDGRETCPRTLRVREGVYSKIIKRDRESTTIERKE